MSRSFVNTEQLQALRQGLLQFSQQGQTSLNVFSSRYRSFMASFDPKRHALETELERASQALSACARWRGLNGEHRSCDAEAARYAKARERYNAFQSLINEAWSLISAYESEAQIMQNNIVMLEARPIPYLEDTIQIIEEYLAPF